MASCSSLATRELVDTSAYTTRCWHLCAASLTTMLCAGTIPAALVQLPNIRSVDLKQNKFSALEAPYASGVGMPTNSSLTNFRVSFNSIQASLSRVAGCLLQLAAAAAEVCLTGRASIARSQASPQVSMTPAAMKLTVCLCLQGAFPAGLSGFADLFYLVLNSNNFRCESQIDSLMQLLQTASSSSNGCSTPCIAALSAHWACCLPDLRPQRLPATRMPCGPTSSHAQLADLCLLSAAARCRRTRACSLGCGRST